MISSVGSCSVSRRRRGAGEFVVTITLTGSAAAAATISTASITATFVYNAQGSAAYTSYSVVVSSASPTASPAAPVDRQGSYVAEAGKGKGEGGKGEGGKGMGMGKMAAPHENGHGNGSGKGMGMGPGSEHGKTGRMSTTSNGYDSALVPVKGKGEFRGASNYCFG